MADNIRLDSHKLIYHPDTVARWLKGENIYPIEIEISPSGACNHRCIFCALDYLGYKPSFLEKEILLENIKSMAEHGLKSVVCAGEGEPLLNKEMPQIANEIKAMGVDVAMSTNGVLFTPEKIEQCLDSFTWVRFSVATMHQETYQAIHKGQACDLELVKKHIAYAAQYKKQNELHTTLGVQCILIPQSVPYVLEMAKELRELGVDYFTVKPYSQHLHSDNHFEVDYEDLLKLEQKLKSYETEQYKIYFRADAMRRVHKQKCYDRCWGLPFMTHIDAHGNVWPCVAHIGCEEYKYGNIYEQTFDEIWNGEQRRKVMEGLAASDINKVCREACRLDVMNQYLQELKYPGEHVNFI